MKFKRGYVVKLKSGGPKMTIKGVVGVAESTLTEDEQRLLKLAGFEKGSVYCQWRNANNKVESNCFYPDQLGDM